MTIRVGELEWESGGAHTDDHLSHGGHEGYLLNLCAGILKNQKKPTLLDIGAHVGLYSVNLAEFCVSVYAVEANPDTYDVLLRNIARNANHHPNTTINALNIAAWDRPEVLTLHDPNGKARGGSTQTLPNTLGAVNGAVTVPGLPLDSVLPESCVPTLIKVDVEGAEAQVLAGLEETIGAYNPTLFIEMHDRYLGNPSIRANVITLLDFHGYEWNDQLTHGEQYYILARPEGA